MKQEQLQKNDAQASQLQVCSKACRECDTAVGSIHCEMPTCYLESGFDGSGASGGSASLGTLSINSPKHAQYTIMRCFPRTAHFSCTRNKKASAAVVTQYMEERNTAIHSRQPQKTCW